MAQLVVAKDGEELAPAGEQRELPRHHGAAAGRLRPELLGVHDGADSREPRHARKLHPLDMTNDGASHESPPCHV